MRLLPIAPCFAGMFAAQAFACDVNHVTLTDFTPAMGRFSDGHSSGLQLSGGLDNFCDETVNVTLSIVERGTLSFHGPYYITVKSVPPGGKGFDNEGNVPFFTDAQNVEVTVSGVAAANYHPDSVSTWANAPQAGTVPAYQQTPRYTPYADITRNTMYNWGRSLSP